MIRMYGRRQLEKKRVAAAESFDVTVGISPLNPRVSSTAASIFQTRPIGRGRIGKRLMPGALASLSADAVVVIGAYHNSTYVRDWSGAGSRRSRVQALVSHGMN